MVVQRDLERLRILTDRQLRLATMLSKCAAEQRAILAGLATRSVNLNASAEAGELRAVVPNAIAIPIVDAGSMSVTWAGHNCHLGNTVLFRLFSRLAKRPGRYIHFNRLFDEAWGTSARSDEAVRIAVHRLRSKLRESGMTELASAIRSADRSYGLFLAEATNSRRM